MPFQVSPGVNVSEIDLTTVVPAVSTTEGAVVGQFQWGPVEQPILVDSEDRLLNIFQKPSATVASAAEDFFTAANFLSYGNALNVVRVVNTSDALNAAQSTAALIKNSDSAVPTTDTWYAKYPGVLGNSLSVSVCSSATAWEQTITKQTTGAAGATTLTVTSNAADLASVQVGDVIKFGPNYVQDAVVVSKVSNGGNTVQTITIDRKINSNAAGTGLASFKRAWAYQGNFDQAPGTTVNGVALGASGDEAHIAIVDANGALTGTKGAVLETYSGVSLGSDAKTEDGAGNFFVNVINQQSAYISVSTNNILDSGSALSGTDYTTNADKPLVQNYPLSGGNDGTAVTPANKIVGYDLFKSAEDIDISLILGGNADVTLATHLITSIAESRKDCIVVISPEKADVVNNTSYAGKERDDIIAYRDTLPSSSYAVMDSGWKYQYDKYNDIYRYIPLNADTAGLMVQTDLTRDPWFSPAGYNRGNVKNAIKLAYNPSKGDRDQLYKKGVNPVVTFPGQGTVLFGDKTMLSKPSAFDRINVRRLFIVLEKAIATASKFTLFEFNDEFTRSQFTNLVVPFLRDVQGRRGITDFQVVCDGTNNTGEVIDRNEFIGDIYIKPARSINFIQLNFVAVRSGVEFSEIVGRA